MFQYSIYTRHCPSKENAEVHVKRVAQFLPKEGKVCVMTITDKQFASIKIFDGCAPTHANVDAIQLDLF